MEKRQNREKRDISNEEFKELHDIYRIPVFKRALDMLGSLEDAEDVRQIVATKLWQGFDPNKGDPLSFALTICDNECRSRLRKRRTENQYEELFTDKERDYSGDSSQDYVQRHETRRLLSVMCNRLSPKQRAVVELKYGEGLNSVEIAEKLNCLPGSVRKAYYEAMKKLRPIAEKL